MNTALKLTVCSLLALAAPAFGQDGPRRGPDNIRVEKHGPGPGRIEFGRGGGGGGARSEARAAALAEFGSRSSKALIIQNGDLEEKELKEIQEDLAVMSRVLGKAAEEHVRGPKFAGIELVALPGSRSSRALYLEDYGVIFTVEVNLPLQGSAEPPPEEEKDAGEPSEEWENARRELFGHAGHPRFEYSAAEFDAGAVNRLRDALIDALRNASNIRHLPDNAWVTVVVRGRGGDKTVVTSDQESFRVWDAAQGAFAFAFGGDVHGATMVLKAKKSDLDALAGEKASLDQVKEKVKIALY